MCILVSLSSVTRDEYYHLVGHGNDFGYLTPDDFYRRLGINMELNEKLGVRISGFPMRYIPITDTRRGHVSSFWKWRWLRGIQCVLQATRGLVSPNSEFVKAAFGKDIKEFYKILSMPDRYIIYRDHYKNNGADEWGRKFRRLSKPDRSEFLDLLERLNRDRRRKQTITELKKFRSLLEHYYPNAEIPPRLPEGEQVRNENWARTKIEPIGSDHRNLNLGTGHANKI